MKIIRVKNANLSFRIKPEKIRRVESALASKTAGTWTTGKQVSSSYANSYYAIGVITLHNGETITMSTEVYPSAVKQAYIYAGDELLQTITAQGDTTALYTNSYTNESENDVTVYVNTKQETLSKDGFNIAIS